MSVVDGEPTIAYPGALPPVDVETQQAAMLAHLEDANVEEGRSRLAQGALALLAAGGVGAIITYVTKEGIDGRLTLSMPLVEQARVVVNSVDDALYYAGQVAVPGALAAIGGVKVAATWSDAARFADQFSRTEPGSDGQQRGLIGRVAHRAGLPAAAGALGTFTAAVATEIGEGPNRSIDALSQLLPGDAVVTQYDGAMPMVTSSINQELEQRIVAEAAQEGIQVHVFGLSLGTVEYGGKSYTDLIVGVDVDPNSPLAWQSGQGCSRVPVILDGAVGIPVGSEVQLNGVDAVVVGTADGTSSMNRVGGVMDGDALQACLQQDPHAPHHGLVLETSRDHAQALVDAANHGLGAPVAVLTPDQYIHNSQTFWESNVQPITNVLSLTAGGMALLAIAGVVGSRMIRNRREIGAMLAAGASLSVIRLAEVIRSVKDGALAAGIGVTAAVPATIAANSLEVGFNAGVGPREVLIGSALTIFGTVTGAIMSLLRLKRIANPEENTRA